MESRFSGMTVELENTRAKLVFPTGEGEDAIRLHTNNSNRQHIHYDIEVHFILEGSYRIVTPQSEYAAEKNSVCLIPKGCSHQVVPDGRDNRSFNMLVTLYPKGKGPRAKTVTQLWNGIRETQIFPEQVRICDHIRDFRTACRSNDEMSRHIRSSLMMLIFCLVTEQLSGRFPNRSLVAEACKLSYAGEWFDAELENYLMRNYCSKLSREDVAKHIGISAAQLSRIIRRNYGANYTQLMTSLRMADAKKLLKTEKTVTQIAKLLGYASYNGFATAFKKYYRITPEEMRKEVRK